MFSCLGTKLSVVVAEASLRWGNKVTSCTVCVFVHLDCAQRMQAMHLLLQLLLDLSVQHLPASPLLLEQLLDCRTPRTHLMLATACVKKRAHCVEAA